MLPSAKTSVIFQRLDDGAVLFAPESELYFGLNAVGALVWENLAPVRRSLDDLVTHLADRYPDADPSTVRMDVQELLERLWAEGLVTYEGSSGTDVLPGA